MEWILTAWKFRNEIAIIAIILVLVTAGFYIKSVFQERDKLETEIAVLKEEMTAVKKQITLNEDIANAIRKIKIQSNNYVRVVETTPSPASGSVSVVIPSGVFHPMSTVSKTNAFRNISSSDEGVINSTP